MSRGLGWQIHGSVEDTKLSTNKQHTLSMTTLLRLNTPKSKDCVQSGPDKVFQDRFLQKYTILYMIHFLQKYTILKHFVRKNTRSIFYKNTRSFSTKIHDPIHDPFSTKIHDPETRSWSFSTKIHDPIHDPFSTKIHDPETLCPKKYTIHFLQKYTKGGGDFARWSEIQVDRLYSVRNLKQCIRNF
jgi:hypothetical protein